MTNEEAIKRAKKSLPFGSKIIHIERGSVKKRSSSWGAMRVTYEYEGQTYRTVLSTQANGTDK
jgi:hypothetical protein